ncbi:cellulase family glycosylhydrolase [Nocardioides terrisoli]|uniref:cellulase family glycosylhydrolase n=1 Tax=Nocardioides terrisoli TaxID=3388267 RepID=UPI00287BC63E|nr:cellulase family glycosylhydrolase [Nocardioides marmorisolisilvae]
MGRRGALAVLAGLVGLAMVAALQAQVQAETASTSRSAARPQTAGRFLVDSQGRALITAGVNMVYKLAPYRPDAAGFGADDAAFLQRNGFTAVRLGLIWKAVEPRPGEYDDDYLAHIRATVRTLARHGIRSLLDFHQDLYNERFQGEGAPDWAVIDQGVPNQPQAGFPANYFLNPAMNRAYDHFWNNAAAPDGVGLVDHYAAAWRHVVAFMATTPGLLGIDVFNEPWPGTAYATCIPLGCRSLDAKVQRMSQKVIDAVHTVQPRLPVFYEPTLLFNSGVSTFVRPTGADLGFSFHDYCVSHSLKVQRTDLTGAACNVLNNRVWNGMERQLQLTGATPLLTEFGATTDQTVLADMVNRAATHRVGWTYWAYCGCGDPTTSGPGAEQALVLDPAEPPSGANVETDKLRALAVPHPVAVAGTPTAYSFDRTSSVFSATWSTRRALGNGRFSAGARSTIATPVIEYPRGYTARVVGGSVVSAPNAPRLAVSQSPGAATVTVTVSPR